MKNVLINIQDTTGENSIQDVCNDSSSFITEKNKKEESLQILKNIYNDLKNMELQTSKNIALIEKYIDEFTKET